MKVCVFISIFICILVGCNNTEDIPMHDVYVPSDAECIASGFLVTDRIEIPNIIDSEYWDMGPTLILGEEKIIVSNATNNTVYFFNGKDTKKIVQYGAGIDEIENIDHIIPFGSGFAVCDIMFHNKIIQFDEEGNYVSTSFLENSYYDLYEDKGYLTAVPFIQSYNENDKKPLDHIFCLHRLYWNRNGSEIIWRNVKASYLISEEEFYNQDWAGLFYLSGYSLVDRFENNLYLTHLSKNKLISCDYQTGNAKDIYIVGDIDQIVEKDLQVIKGGIVNHLNTDIEIDENGFIFIGQGRGIPLEDKSFNERVYIIHVFNPEIKYITSIITDINPVSISSSNGKLLISSKDQELSIRYFDYEEYISKWIQCGI